MDFTIQSIERHSKNVKVFVFTPKNGTMPAFRSGQFVSVSFVHDGKKYGPKPYSVSSSPLKKDGFELTIEKVGEFTTAIFQLEEGATVNVIGPVGKFVLDEPVPRNLVLIAAGTGIAPMMSMLRHAQDSHTPGHVTFFYSCRTQEDILHKDELQHRAKEHDNFTFIQTLTREPEDSNWQGHTGRINEAMLKTHIRDKPGAVCYICGSLEFTKTMEDLLVDLSVPATSIKKEGWG